MVAVYASVSVNVWSTSEKGRVSRRLWSASFTWSVDMFVTRGVAAVNMFHSRDVSAA